MIIHTRVRFEFPKVSAARLALGSLNLSVLCLVVDQGLMVFLLREEGGLLAISTTHRPRHEVIGPFFLPAAKSVGRSALFLVGRSVFWSIGHIFWARPFLCLFQALCMPAVLAGEHRPSPPYTRMEGFEPKLSFSKKLWIWFPIRGEPPFPYQRFSKLI